MENTVQKIPFLRPTIALAFGIFIASLFDLQINYSIAISVSLFICTVFIYHKFTFKLSTFFGISIHLLYISIGIFAFANYNKKPLFIQNGIFMATILEKPQEKKNSFKSIILLSLVQSETKTLKSDEKLLVYFNKTDEAQKLTAGDIIHFSAIPQTIKNYGNPSEFDYKKFLERKRIYRQVYLDSKQWNFSGNNSALSLNIKAEQFRDKLLTIYRNQNFGKNELEILSALTLGYKRELDPETKRIFSNSGAMHILAVSGLHVGIVFYIITILFGFLKKHKTGKIFFILLAVIILWLYAFITGLSPSVMRAASMFSIFVVGENIKRKSNSYNSLAASALFLLLINPNNLFMVGFQLSYSAVFGILFFQPYFSKLIQTNNKVLKFVWNLMSISISAQIATFPITSFYFNQFPSYFLITNLIVIPAAMLLIPLGISLLVFSEISFFSIVISKTIQLLINLCYRFLSQIEQLPFSIHEISIQSLQLFFIFGIFFALLLFIKSYHSKFLKAILVFILFLTISVFHQNIKQKKSNEIIVYNTPKNLVIHLISGRKNYVLANLNSNDSLQIIHTINQTKIKKNLDSPVLLSLKDSFNNQQLILKEGFVFFRGKTMIIDKNISDLKERISPNFIINPKHTSRLEDYVSRKTIIVTNKSFKTNQKNFYKTIYQIPLQGAFQEYW